MKAVFASCVLNAEKCIGAAQYYIKSIAACFDEVRFLFVDGGSTDGTRDALLSAFGCGNTVILDSHAAEQRIARKGSGLRLTAGYKAERLAVARQMYLDAVRRAVVSEEYRFLVVFDLDEVLFYPVCRRSIERAVRLLLDGGCWGVFANSAPLYYDVWALRAKGWSEDDCWERVWRESGGNWNEGLARKYVGMRQRALPVTSDPFVVESAFGGIGIYRSDIACLGSYEVTERQGWVECEHVAFHRSVRAALEERGAKTSLVKDGLRILPSWMVRAPSDHLRFSWAARAEKGKKVVRLTIEGARRVEMQAPADHPLPIYMKKHPLYDRRLPMLARVVESNAGSGVIIDVGGNIGDTVALMRASGVTLPIITMEPEPEFFSYLMDNVGSSPDLMGPVVPVFGFGGGDKCAGRLRKQGGTASVEGKEAEGATIAPAYDLGELLCSLEEGPVVLLKTDVDGLDQCVLDASRDLLRKDQPVIWAEADVREQAAIGRWKELWIWLADNGYEKAAIFDNYGFLMASGAMGELGPVFEVMIDYCFRRKAGEGWAGQTPVHYIDVALFPRGVGYKSFEDFMDRLPEAVEGL